MAGPGMADAGEAHILQDAIATAATRADTVTYKAVQSNVLSFRDIVHGTSDRRRDHVCKGGMVVIA